MKPLIFIPGIKATSLVNTNTFDYDYVWNAYDSTRSAVATQIGGEYMEEKLQADPRFDLEPLEVIDHTHVAGFPYERPLANLARKLRDRYDDRSPIYLFGYDWRKSNVESGRRLARFVQYLRDKLGPDNVEGFRFLTHSMGGLVFSCFLNELEGDFSLLDKVVLCAPPFRGSPDALVEMVEGAGRRRSVMNWVLRRDADVRKVIRTYPGVFELLPYYEGAIRREESGEPLSLLELEHWQSNIHDDDPELFQRRLEDLARFRSEGLFDLGRLPRKNRNRVMVVAGEDDDTLQTVPVRRREGRISNFVLLDEIEENEQGDGTVPLRSASAHADRIFTLAVQRRSMTRDVSGLSFHGLFLRHSHVQNIVQRFFTTDRVTPKLPDRDRWWESIGGGVRRVEG